MDDPGVRPGVQFLPSLDSLFLNLRFARHFIYIAPNATPEKIFPPKYPQGATSAPGDHDPHRGRTGGRQAGI
ncbi:hypothetical protein JCM39068_41370 [Desulfocastanea catecholica]